VAAAGLGLGAYALASAADPPPAAARHASVQPSNPVQHTRDATLAAWTVARQPDGTIAVTIRDLENTAGLQQRLNALGVPVAVYSRVRSLPGCLDFEGNGNLLGMGLVFDEVPVGRQGIPRGDTLEIAVNPHGWPPTLPAPHQRFPAGTGAGAGGIGFGSVTQAGFPTISISLVYTGSNCS
jgi:hypothetical protein